MSIPATFAASLRLIAACVLGLLGACASSQSQTTPEQAVMALARALGEGKLEAAYALMSDDYRKRVSLETWKRTLGENANEVVELSNALAHVRGPGREEAVLSYGDEELRLHRDGDRWLIATDLTSFYDQSTPRAALAAFVRALERKRYDMVMRLCPDADQEGMSTETIGKQWSLSSREEVERLVIDLRAHLNDPIEEVGNHATMPYGDSMHVQFIREDGLWKIVDAK